MMRCFVPIMMVLGVFFAACGTVPHAPAAATPVFTESATIKTTDVLGGVLTATYPQGWSASESEGIILLGSREGISPDGSVPAGEVAVSISGIAPALASTIVTDGNITPGKVLDAYKNTLGAEIQLGETTEITLANKLAARLSVSTDEGDSLIVAIEEDGAFMVVIGVTAKGELPQHEAMILAIAEQAAYDIAAE